MTSELGMDLDSYERMSQRGKQVRLGVDMRSPFLAVEMESACSFLSDIVLINYTLTFNAVRGPTLDL
jgi:hypothetical protein